jgi:hypothetical protein
LGSAIRKWLPKGVDLLRFCRRPEDSTAHLEGVRELFNDGIAHSVLFRSPAQQYLMAHRAMEYSNSNGTRINPYLMPKDCGLQIQEPEWLLADVEPFRKRVTVQVLQKSRYGNL